MAHRWCSTRSRRKRRVSESRRVTTWCGNKTSRNKRWRKRPKIRKNFKDAKKFVHHFRDHSPDGYRSNCKEGAGTADGEGEQAKAAFARACECDRPALRLFSALAKESAPIETGSRRRDIERSCSGDGRFSGEPKLR